MEDPACTRARQSSTNVAALERDEGFVVLKQMPGAYRPPSPPALCATKNEEMERIREAVKRLKAQQGNP
jgi:hypothetical protein